MKEFKSFDEQLRILRDRGLIVADDEKAKRFLEQENYYNVINGYKDLFLEKDANGRPIEPETSKAGTDFKELRNLYLFDRELRSILLKNLLIFENSIKTQISYEFSNAYLELSNYIDDPKSVMKQISMLTKIISDRVDKEPSIKHYVEVHGEVPLWVLMNYLTIGNVSYLFGILTESLKNRIAKFYSEKYKVQYGESLQISSSDLSAIIKMTNIVRNKCAHEERVYNSNLKNIRSANIVNHFRLAEVDNKKLFLSIVMMKAVLDKAQFSTFYSEIKKLFECYEDKFQTISFNDILEIMGITISNFEKLV
ncbi:Abi family protein [Lactococcus kimchii]|uniref:Abi family protein n=1 Tax=Lactococcus sp. S-13 TaxID=2507158 RepID=UPI001023A023|nr:Abi family protein [Lactococcus sp. S-13]RZI48555.1 Abi family protein [Lactococcus sp. S-13]